MAKKMSASNRLGKYLHPAGGYPNGAPPGAQAPPAQMMAQSSPASPMASIPTASTPLPKVSMAVRRPATRVSVKPPQKSAGFSALMGLGRRMK